MDMEADCLRPHGQLLVKLGSIIVHFQEWTSNNGHEFDKTALDSLLQDKDVIEWMREMNDLALLPMKR